MLITVSIGRLYDCNDNSDNNLSEICMVALCVRGIRRMGAAEIALCYMRLDSFDAYWKLNLNRWYLWWDNLLR